MSVEQWVWAVVGLALGATVALVLQVVHLVAVMRWADRRTAGLNYYGLPRRGRRRFKRLLRVHRLLLSPVLGVLRKTARFRLASGTFKFRGVAAPRAGACSPGTFERAVQYEPQSDDVFVVTQMRCGTTWMQHLVFQTLTRGARDLAREDFTLNAVSPWLESDKTVAVEDAPRVGDGPQARIIKTHLPASLCPFDVRAKYIYVVRHPVSCFASCVDFVRSNLRGFEPDLEDFLHWYTTADAMWWGTWVAHVDAWWAKAAAAPNVLFVRFEDMKQDLDSVIRQVAEFLDVPPLEPHEMDRVAEHCSFAAMRRNADVFEMHAPHLLQTPGGFFVSGKVDRYADISPQHRQWILDWCRRELRDGSFPAAEFYPDLATDGASAALAGAEMQRNS